jgi:hypothetical protein
MMTDERTLRVSGSGVFKTLALAALMLIALSAVLEAAARLLNTPRSTGINHHQFDGAWQHLAAMANEGKIDCIFLGASTVHRGFDPSVVSQAYQTATGEQIQCYNFGIGQMNVWEAASLAEILVDEYHPALLIYGIGPRNFFPDNNELTKADWTRYTLGKPTISGWLIHNSHAYSTYLAAVRWYRFSEADLHEKQTRDGFEAFNGIGTDQDLRPPRHIRQDMATYAISGEAVDAFKSLLALQDRGVEIVVVEMPLPESYLKMFSSEKNYHKLFTGHIQAITDQQHVLFWTTDTQPLIPRRAWYDYHHVNAEGAALLSTWLGDQLAKAVLSGLLSNPATVSVPEAIP